MKIDLTEIGKRTQQLRMSKGITQEALGNAINVHQATISKFEYGQYDITLTELIKLCEYLNVSIAWLISPIDNEFTRDEQRLIDEITNLIIKTKGSNLK